MKFKNWKKNWSRHRLLGLICKIRCLRRRRWLSSWNRNSKRPKEKLTRRQQKTSYRSRKISNWRYQNSISQLNRWRSSSKTSNFKMIKLWKYPTRETTSAWNWRQAMNQRDEKLKSWSHSSSPRSRPKWSCKMSWNLWEIKCYSCNTSLNYPKQSQASKKIKVKTKSKRNSNKKETNSKKWPSASKSLKIESPNSRSRQKRWRTSSKRESRNTKKKSRSSKKKPVVCPPNPEAQRWPNWEMKEISWRHK